MTLPPKRRIPNAIHAVQILPWIRTLRQTALARTWPPQRQRRRRNRKRIGSFRVGKRPPRVTTEQTETRRIPPTNTQRRPLHQPPKTLVPRIGRRTVKRRTAATSLLQRSVALVEPCPPVVDARTMMIGTSVLLRMPGLVAAVAAKNRDAVRVLGKNAPVQRKRKRTTENSTRLTPWPDRHQLRPTKVNSWKTRVSS